MCQNHVVSSKMAKYIHPKRPTLELDPLGVFWPTSHYWGGPYSIEIGEYGLIVNFLWGKLSGGPMRKQVTQDPKFLIMIMKAKYPLSLTPHFIFFVKSDFSRHRVVLQTKNELGGLQSCPALDRNINARTLLIIVLFLSFIYRIGQQLQEKVCQSNIYIYIYSHFQISIQSSVDIELEVRPLTKHELGHFESLNIFWI